ncbi:MAG TPA: citrate synthase [Caulobacteraceae bacterium]|nr:citrate synthase [Caulobacteraceae bacterium]
MNARIEGLEDVVAARTVLSDVDGEGGRLIIRGAQLEDLAGKVSFEAAALRLWDGFFADLPSDLTVPLGNARAQVFAHLSALDADILPLEPLSVMRALMARLADGDDLETALRLLAAPAVLAPAILRRAHGQAPVAPEPRLGQAADILRMYRGEGAAQIESWALEAYLVTVSDHGLNASTFAARVAASTRAGLTSAAIAGLCALKGPLHGGAPGPVLDMLDDIGEPARARAWIESALDRGERIMGFGHRVYRVRDPRADALKAVVGALAAGSRELPGRLAFAEAIEAAILAILAERKPARSLQTNVEFYTALLLEALGFSREAFTCIFAAGRMAGWIAHAREQRALDRLVRPRSVYVGPRPGPPPAIAAA